MIGSILYALLPVMSCRQDRDMYVFFYRVLFYDVLFAYIHDTIWVYGGTIKAHCVWDFVQEGFLGRSLSDGIFLYTMFSACKHSLKKNKAPGEDNITTEMIHWLNHENTEKLLDLTNHMWNNDMDENILTAHIVAVPKRTSQH